MRVRLSARGMPIYVCACKALLSSVQASRFTDLQRLAPLLNIEPMRVVEVAENQCLHYAGTQLQEAGRTTLTMCTMRTAETVPLRWQSCCKACRLGCLLSDLSRFVLSIKPVEQVSRVQGTAVVVIAGEGAAKKNQILFQCNRTPKPPVAKKEKKKKLRSGMGGGMVLIVPPTTVFQLRFAH